MSDLNLNVSGGKVTGSDPDGLHLSSASGLVTGSAPELTVVDGLVLFTGQGSTTNPTYWPGPATVPVVGPSYQVVDYRFEVLDRFETYQGTLDSVIGGSVKWSSTSSVHSGGSIDVDDIGQDIDWLHSRIRVFAVLQEMDGTTRRTPLGVYLPAAPTEKWVDNQRAWTVELTDKLGILDGDIAMQDDFSAFAVPAGADVISVVKQVIESMNEDASAILPESEALPSMLTWKREDTKLKVVNDVLQAGGFFSLWCDGMGQYRVTEYVSPADRVPKFEKLDPFTDGLSSLLGNEFQRDQDIYDVPNRYVCFSQGDGENEGLVAVATNENDNSPFSYQNVGHWRTKTTEGMKTTSETALQSQAKMLLSSATSVTSTLTVECDFLEGLLMNDAIRFHTSPAVGGFDFQCYVSDIEHSFDPLARDKLTIHQAVV